ASMPGDRYFNAPDWPAYWAPRGDIVTLKTGEMTPEQRAAVAAVLQGALQEQQREAQESRRQDPSNTHYPGFLEWNGKAPAAPDLESAAVSLFRWGDPNWQGLSLRVEFQSGGRPWAIYSSIGVPPSAQKSYGDDLRKGQFQVWPGAQAEVNRYLRAARKSDPPAAVPDSKSPPGDQADPILDALVSVTWALRLRDAGYKLTAGEVLAALCRDI